VFDPFEDGLVGGGGIDPRARRVHDDAQGVPDMQRSLMAGVLASSVLAAGSGEAAGPERSPFAARAEGYVGAAVFDSDDADAKSFFNGGGAGSAVVLLGPLQLQGDVFGDWTNLDHDATNYGAGGHFGFADPDRGVLEVTGAYQNLEQDGILDDPLWRVGGEGELYFGAATFGWQSGYLRDGDTNRDGYYARGLVRLYPTENLKLEGVGGVEHLASDTCPVVRTLIEYRPDGWPVGLFARWEVAFDSSLDQHLAVAGVRIYLEGLRFDSRISLRESDRVYFRDACVHFVLRARTC
jgi:hypothetical protein